MISKPEISKKGINSKFPERPQLSGLKISNKNDKQEQEADAVADKVMLMPANKHQDISMSGSPKPGLHLLENQDKNTLTLQANEKENDDRLQLMPDIHLQEMYGNPADSGGETNSGGKSLLAYELTHTIQQTAPNRANNNNTADKISRKTEQGENSTIQLTPKDPWEKHYKGWETYHKPGGDTLTRLSPTKLKPDGPFTIELIRYISTHYTKASALSNPEGGHLIVQLLESSPTFLKIAAKLDKLYKKKKTGFSISPSDKGSSYIPKGTPYKSHLQPQETVSSKDDDTVKIDYTNYAYKSSDAKQAIGFASIFIHEAAHAYRSMKKLVSAGVKGYLKDEVKVRKLEIKMMKEMLDQVGKGGFGKHDKELKKITKEKIKETEDSGLKKDKVAHNIVSSSGLTYYENFYFNKSRRRYYKKYDSNLSATKSEIRKKIEALKDPMYIGKGSMPSKLNEVEEILDFIKKDHPTEITKKGSAAVTQISLAPLFTLVDLKDLSDSGLNSTEKTLVNYVKLIHLSVIKKEIELERKQGGFTPGSDDAIKQNKELAKKYFGYTKPYKL